MSKLRGRSSRVVWGATVKRKLKPKDTWFTGLPLARPIQKSKFNFITLGRPSQAIDLSHETEGESGLCRKKKNLCPRFLTGKNRLKVASGKPYLDCWKGTRLSGINDLQAQQVCVELKTHLQWITAIITKFRKSIWIFSILGIRVITKTCPFMKFYCTNPLGMLLFKYLQGHF